MKKILALLLLLCLAITTSCRKSTPELENPNDTTTADTWQEVFELFWQKMSTNYMFWDITDIDWDETYDHYHPLFGELEINRLADDSTALVYLTEMTADLVDNHFRMRVGVGLNSGSIISAGVTQEIHPSSTKIKERDYYHEKYDKSYQYEIIKGGLSGRVSNFVTYTTNTSASFNTYSCLIDQSAAYLFLSDFSLYDLNELSELVLDNFHELIEQTPDLKGIIIDLRGNSGGAIADQQHILAPLIDQSHQMFYQRTKNGLSRMSYTPWAPVTLEPVDPVDYDHNIPIVVLADLYSISMAEMTTMAIMALPNGVFIGERTYGGHAVLTGYEAIYNSGSFTTPKIEVICGSYATRPMFSDMLEGRGITPDIEVLWDIESMKNGVDNQLERAMTFIKDGE